MYNELKEMLCAELESLEHKSNFYASDLGLVFKLTASINNIDKINGYYMCEEYEKGSSASASEFLATVSGTQMNGVLEVLDEHLQAVGALYPKEYRAVINRIKELK